MTKVKRIDKLLRARTKITKILDSDCDEDVEERAQVQHLWIGRELKKESCRIKNKNIHKHDIYCLNAYYINL